MVSTIRYKIQSSFAFLFGQIFMNILNHTGIFTDIVKALLKSILKVMLRVCYKKKEWSGYICSIIGYYKR